MDDYTVAVPPRFKRRSTCRRTHYLLLGCTLLAGIAYSATLPRILVLTETAGWDHGTKSAAHVTISELGVSGGFLVDTVSSTEGTFTDAILTGYSAVCFVNTTGNIFTDGEAAAFERYMQSGGGYVGVHASTDAEYGRPWYGDLTGANFNGHPFNIATARVAVLDKHHPSTLFITADTLSLTDEWYFWADNPDFRNNPLIDPAIRSGITVLMSLVESSISGSTLGGYHPICWYKRYGSGRVWYCGLGHNPDTFGDSLFKQMLLGAIRYAAGIITTGTKADKQIVAGNRSIPGTQRVTLYDLFGRVVNREKTSKIIAGNNGVYFYQKNRVICTYLNVR